MLPSNYGGDALANLLAGDANFSGKMPFTYPRLINALATYDYGFSGTGRNKDGYAETERKRLGICGI